MCGLLISLTAHSAELGIGASVKSSDSSIYLPITVSPKFRIEPYLRYTDLDTESSSISTISSESLAIGVGLFRLIKPAENISIYYGGRVAYLSDETTFRPFAVPVPPIGFIQPVQFESRSELDGYSIFPAAGFEYHFSEHLSIGVEVGWEYSKLDGTTSITGSPIEGTKIERNNTRANVILRFFF